MTAHWLTQAFVGLARTIERALLGQSQFSMTTSEFASAPTIDNPTQAKMAMADVRQRLGGEFKIELKWPILLELKVPPGLGWRASFYNPDGNLARHQVVELKGVSAHQVLVRPGLTRTRFMALLAHELVHAFQREQNYLNQNLSLREGMARWVEYHFLNVNSPEAKRLLELKHYTFGRSIESILEYERKAGRPATLAWLRAEA